MAIVLVSMKRKAVKKRGIITHFHSRQNNQEENISVMNLCTKSLTSDDRHTLDDAQKSTVIGIMKRELQLRPPKNGWIRIHIFDGSIYSDFCNFAYHRTERE